MQVASRQLFESAEEERVEEERVEEGVPPSPQSRVLPTEPVNPPPTSVYTCSCGQIDWMTPLKNGGIRRIGQSYNYTDGTPHHQGVPSPGKDLPCGDKINMGIITYEQARINCRYCDWDDPNTKMPTDLIVYLQKWAEKSNYDSRFDINHPDHYLNHYQSLQELIDHLQDPSLYPFDPIQGTTDVFQAQNDIADIEALKQASLESQQT